MKSGAVRGTLMVALLVTASAHALQHHPVRAAGSPRRVIQDDEFADLCAGAIAGQGVLNLAGRMVELRAPFVMKGAARLRVAGGTITGSGHAIFQAGGSRKGLLELCDVELAHVASPERSEKRSLGAALFARGKSRLVLRGCSISSEAGFGLWLVQKAQVEVDSCEFCTCGRSSVVCFEDASLELENTLITDANCHAVCARGDTRVVVRHSRIERAELRAIHCCKHEQTSHLMAEMLLFCLSPGMCSQLVDSVD